MVATRAPLGRLPTFGRLSDGSSNAIVTSTLGLAGLTKVAIAWWEFSSTTTGTRCVMEMGANGFDIAGQKISIFRNDVAAGTMEIGWTSGGTNTTTVARWTQPTSGRWNHIACNVDTSAATAATQLPAVWVNGVAQSLTYSPTGAASGSLKDEVFNIGARNGSSFRNDTANAQVAWIGGYNFGQGDVTALYQGTAHPKEYLLRHGTRGFIWQPEYVGSPDRLFVKGMPPAYATHAGTTPRSFPQRMVAGRRRFYFPSVVAEAPASEVANYIILARRRGRR